jgi:hypothetical protein
LELDAAEEGARLLTGELLPAAEREFLAAFHARNTAFMAFYVQSRAACERRMAELLNQVVAERDRFMAAFDQFGKDYGTSLNSAFLRPDDPKAAHNRLGRIEHHISGSPDLEFTPPPAPALAPLPVLPVSPPADVAPASPAPENAVPVDATPAAEAGEAVKDVPPTPPARRYLLAGDVTAPEPVNTTPGPEVEPTDEDPAAEAAETAEVMGNMGLAAD